MSAFTWTICRGGSKACDLATIYCGQIRQIERDLWKLTYPKGLAFAEDTAQTEQGAKDLVEASARVRLKSAQALLEQSIPAAPPKVPILTWTTFDTVRYEAHDQMGLVASVTLTSQNERLKWVIRFVDEVAYIILSPSRRDAQDHVESVHAKRLVEAGKTEQAAVVSTPTSTVVGYDVMRNLVVEFQKNASMCSGRVDAWESAARRLDEVIQKAIKRTL